MDKESFMKLTNQEKNFLEKIIAISALDKKVGKNFFRSQLVATTISLLSGENEIIIPYLCKLKIKYNQILTPEGIKLEVKLEAEPSEELVEEIKCILAEEDPPTKVYFKKEIAKELRNYLEIDEIDV